MYNLKFKEREYTCPKGNLKPLALVFALDKGITKGAIHDDETAKTFLESEGFEIQEIKDPEPLTEVPKYANWYDRTHRDLYNKLFYQGIGRELTEEENEFCKAMYHFEEMQFEV